MLGAGIWVGTQIWPWKEGEHCMEEVILNMSYNPKEETLDFQIEGQELLYQVNGEDLTQILTMLGLLKATPDIKD